MASIFKRRKGKNEPYTIQYVDHHGKRRTKIGFTDKGLTEQLAAKLESETRLRSTGMIDPMQDRYAAQKLIPIERHIEEFEETRGESTERYVKLMLARVRLIVETCEFRTLTDIDGEKIQASLRKLQKTEDIGARTYNHYLQAFDTFCNWCVTTKRLLHNPLAGARRLNTAVDVRHERRALTAEEVSKLIASARGSGIRIQTFTGEQRARIYTLAYMTGLRKKEIGSLTPRSFHLESNPPALTVEAACSKHRREDVLPLHPDLVGMLKIWLRGIKPAEKLFPNLERKKTHTMVRKDLERAGIPYENEDGIADFHASGRHTHITELLRNGATLPEAKELARHSDVNMTMRYTHIGLNDQAKAVANLPSPKQNSDSLPAKLDGCIKQAVTAALQMRCISCSAESQPESDSDSKEDDQKRHNPCQGKGYVDLCRRSSDTDKTRVTGLEPAASSVTG